jgi:cytochrome bd ubiquinol oxidase subunit II
MYLALVIILLALIVRGVAFEWRGKSDSTRWRGNFSWMLAIGSALIPLLFGVALGDLLYGLPLNQNGDFTGNFLDLLTPYGLWVGFTMVTLVLAHGATFLDLKTGPPVQPRARAAATVFPWIAAFAVLVFAFWTHSLGAGGVLPAPIELLAFLAIVAAAWAARDGHAGWAFAATTIATACTIASIFVELYPNVMVSSTNSAYNLTVSGTAASDYALKVMTIVALIFTPLVLLYQGWNYYVFRARVTGAPAQEPEHA